MIDKNLIQTGKVRFIYRHFAILGKHSVAAAQASECAREQEKFWPYHDKLFANADSPLAFTERKLKGYATELGLRSEGFNQCLDSGKYLKKVEGETATAASVGARGTPTFFLNGQMIVGAQPFEVFEAAAEKALKKVSAH
jgi:protein-disulfide isomerase